MHRHLTHRNETDAHKTEGLYMNAYLALLIIPPNMNYSIVHQRTNKFSISIPKDIT